MSYARQVALGSTGTYGQTFYNHGKPSKSCFHSVTIAHKNKRSMCLDLANAISWSSAFHCE
jgi:hypothetical protein